MEWHRPGSKTSSWLAQIFPSERSLLLPLVKQV